MKRRALIKHLAEHGCTLRREGTRHPIYQIASADKRTSVPRPTEMANLTARKSCEQLEIPAP